MNPELLARAEIDSHIKRQGLSQKRLCAKAGLSQGYISSAYSHNQIHAAVEALKHIIAFSPDVLKWAHKTSLSKRTNTIESRHITVPQSREPHVHPLSWQRWELCK